MSLTTDPNDPRLKDGQKNTTGQHEIYLVLSDEERAKGFVRPFRDSYVHMGRKYSDGVRILDKPEKHNGKTYVAIANVSSDGKVIGGSYITQSELDQYNNTGGYVGGCRVLTKMNRVISETYQRSPSFYGATYCVGCHTHLPVGEFLWDGTNEKVGS